MEDLKTLQKLAKLMQKEGILRIKHPDLEIELSPLAIFKPSPKKVNQILNAPLEQSEPELTDMDRLLWSSPGHIAENLNGNQNL